MDTRTGRADHIEDILRALHTGEWFTWSDHKNKIYANLILSNKIGVGGELVDNPHSLPTEKSLTDALAQQQSEHDAQKYVRNRQLEYPSIEDQLDMQYWDQDNDTTTWKDAITAVKTKWPKDNSGPIE